MEYLNEFNFTEKDKKFLLSKVPNGVNTDDYLADNLGDMIQKYKWSLDCIDELLELLNDCEEEEVAKIDESLSYDVVETLQNLKII